MAQVVQAVCPGCKTVLRVPADWVGQTIRCKSCGTMMQAKGAAAPDAARTPAPKRKSSPAAKAAPGKTPSPATSVAPAPAATASGGFDFAAAVADVDDSPKVRATRRRKQSSKGPWVVLGVLLGLVVVGAGIGAAFWSKLKPAIEQAGIVPSEAEIEAAKKAKNKPTLIDTANPGGGSGSAFPRRALIISIHNYLYANPIIDGGDGSPNVTMLARSLSNGLNIPTAQVLRLSDMARRDARPPLKNVVEQALEDFLKTSRKQDRILVFFIGHTKQIGDDSFLVPLEGELDRPETLIPLKWVYEKLAKCEARQKVFVLDGNRFNPGQGEERPSSGPMDPKFEAALKAPPAGVQVWSACGKEQQSIELEEASLGLFLNSFRLALTPEKGTKAALEGKIQQPDDLIPMPLLQDAVERLMAAETERRGLKQAPLLAGSAPASGASYDKAELVATIPAFPVVKLANEKVVQSIMSEISVPTVKSSEGNGAGVSFGLLPPFSPEAMKKYEAGKLADDSKLRKAIVRARATLWALSSQGAPQEISDEVQKVKASIGVDLSILQDRFSKPGEGAADTAFKNKLSDNLRETAKIVAEMEDALADLKDAKEEVEAAPPRWQANYTYMLARFQAQLVYLEEYRGLLGAMRKEYPPLDQKNYSGWRMAFKDKASDSVAKKLEKQLRKEYAELAKANKGTPWEVLGKRESLTTLGLEWQQN
jgi:hypothetical protein